MALNDALERLQRRLDAGEISRQEYEAREESLRRTDVAVSPLLKLNLFLGRQLNAQVVRGTVQTISSQGGWLTIDVEGRCVYARASKNPPQISPGNVVVMLVSADGSVAQAYHNETTGANDLGLLRTRYRWAGLSAFGFTAVAIGIFATVFIAASRETVALPLSVLIHTPLYLLSVLGGGVLLLIAFLCVTATGVLMRTHKILQVILAYDPERALERVRAWVPKPKKPR
jgi:hypothetical protein